MKKSTIIKAVPILSFYLYAVVVFIHMLEEKPNNILTGLAAIVVLIPIGFVFFFGLTVWINKVEENENDSWASSTTSNGLFR